MEECLFKTLLGQQFFSDIMKKKKGIDCMDYLFCVFVIFKFLKFVIWNVLLLKEKKEILYEK